MTTGFGLSPTPAGEFISLPFRDELVTKCAGAAMTNGDFGGVAVDPIRVRVPISHSFFTWMAALLLVINLVGFSPTYFLRIWFHAPALPLHVHLHGALFTSWFVLFLIQASLVPRGRLRLHRRLGAAGVALAALIVPATLAVIYSSHSRSLGSGGSEGQVASLLFGQLNLLTAYATFVSPVQSLVGVEPMRTRDSCC